MFGREPVLPAATCDAPRVDNQPSVLWSQLWSSPVANGEGVNADAGARSLRVDKSLVYPVNSLEVRFY